MQIKKLHKLHKKILCILILFVLIYTSFIVLFNNVSYGATYTYTNISNDLPENFEEVYPGYISLIKQISDVNPNWTFKLYETGLDWETVINNEYQGHGSSPKNLVPSNYDSSWICEICGTQNYDTSNRWYCASRQAIAYTMDPRTSLTEANLFQYLQLSNDKNITKEQVANMASKISYLNNPTIIDAIYEVANDPNYNINPFFIIGKILQEQGDGASALCSGQGYKEQYVGYYNLFNVGASGNGTEEVILNGLEYAYNEGWDTPQKAIMGGIGLIKSYINRGQDTLYYQKFNVTYEPYYRNQYAQNIFDAQSIGKILKGYYKEANLLDSNFTFIIPLYKNMSKTPCTSPSIDKAEQGELAYLNVTSTLALRDAPDGTTIAHLYGGTQVLITERAEEKIGGYFWDKVSTPQGTGYMARESKDGSKTYLVVITPPEDNEEVPGEDLPEKNPPQEEEENKFIKVNPNETVKQIKDKYENSIVVNKEGTEISDGTLVGTGFIIKINGIEKHTIIKVGDTSGDGNISPADYVKIKNKIMGVTSMDEITQMAADVNRDGNISPADYVKVKNHIMGVSQITL